jgi:apolipoprotein N-acyltransferase
MCYDQQFDNLMKQASALNLDILISPSYDGRSWTPLHTLQGGIRAVEQGFTFIRITGDGQSAAIDPYFREWANFNSFDQGTDNFYFSVPVLSRSTFYGKAGYLFPFTALFGLLGLISYGLWKGRKGFGMMNAGGDRSS